MSAERGTPFSWLIPLGLATFFLLVAVLSKPFHYDPEHVAALGALYLLLALVIYLPSVVALRWGRLPALVTSTGAAFVLALHLREQTRPSGTAESLDKPAVLAAFVATWAIVAALLFLSLLLLERRPAERRAGLLLLGAAPLFVALLAASYHGSETLRWHLLRHNTLLGAASHHLFAEDTATVRAALWQSRAGIPIPPDVEPAEPIDGAPDIVFVLIDTLRADALAASGGRGGVMPFLDQLVERSLVFTDVKVNAPWTYPSMASFFTGLLPEEHGAVWGGTLDEEQWTLAEALAQRGYRSAAFLANGAWMRAELGLAQGFDLFEQMHVPGDDYPRAEAITTAALDWFDDAAASSGQPRFAYVHYMDPHVPYLAAGIADPADHDTARAAYEADLAYLDAELRRLVETLATRLDGPACLLITADHGEEFGEHGERGHGRVLYDEVLRVPALIHDFDGNTGGIVDEPLEGRDFFALVQGMTDPGFDPRAWARAHAREERYAATYYTNASPIYRWLRPYRAAICLQTIERDGYSLIWSCQGNTYELYDLRADPGQLHNIADREPAVVERLAAAMRDAPQYWTRSVTRDFSPEELERLRALGYLR